MAASKYKIIFIYTEPKIMPSDFFQFGGNEEAAYVTISKHKGI